MMLLFCQVKSYVIVKGCEKLMLNNADVRSYAKERGVKLWELAAFMRVSDMTITRKLRNELTDAEKATLRGHIDAIAADKAKEKAATA